jgi:two-component system CheB/CheR fusion protein
MKDLDSDSTLRIVGIGASAGGLEALELFFDAMPATRDFAFVVIQHLSPDYKSLMGELLAKHTSMEIFHAEDGMEITPGSIYLIPRKKNMTVYKRKLFLTDQEHGLNLPIDIFFQSLAEDAGERAIGIVLSGTGSDGTRGVRAIKEAGGLVIVQDEDDAKFDGMPRSAISTGIVDFVLPAGKIPQELQDFVAGNVRLVSNGNDARFNGASSITKIFMLIKRKTGVDLSFYKETTILRRLERRMGINQIHDVQRYIQFLEESPAEITTLFKEILIGVTRFFRDQQAFDILQQQVIPEIFNGKESTEQIRVWVGGCSTGEEAYSIAILLAEYAEKHYLHNDIKIFATDIDKDAIEFASHGLYPESIAADASPHRLARYFVRKGESYQIAPAIREMVVFAYHNIFKDPPFRRIDLISCRNMLIYLQPVLQKKVLSNFHFSLNSGGYLFLGSSETVGDLGKYFQTVDSRWKIFSCKGESRPSDLSLVPPDTNWRERTEATVRPAESVGRGHRTSEPVYEQLVERYLPPTVIVDENKEVVHTFGDLAPYLTVPSGKMDLGLLKMVRKELAVPVGTALQTSIREDRIVAYDDVALPEDDGATVVLKVSVYPLKGGYNAHFYAVVLDDQGGARRDGGVPAHHFDIEESVRNRMNDLESELLYTKENLQATIEELETSNEELQATNEELLSSNEELQSTNEELQSVNEELITVNSEYQKKIDELSELNDDMDNLLSGSAVGTIFLDGNMVIRKYSPPVAKQISIIKSDIGRPLGDLSHNLVYDDLLLDVDGVMKQGKPRELEVQSRDGEWFLVKIQPYESEHEKTSGIVLSLIDITERKIAEQALLRQHELMMRVLDSNPSAILMLDHRGLIIYANRPGQELLGYDADKLTTMRHNDPAFALQAPDGASIPDGELPYARILRDRQATEEYELMMITGPGSPTPGERLRIRINGSPIFDENGAVEGAVLNLRKASSREG